MGSRKLIKCNDEGKLGSGVSGLAARRDGKLLKGKFMTIEFYAEDIKEIDVQIWPADKVVEKLGINQRLFAQLRSTGRFGPEPLGISTKTSLFFSSTEIMNWLRAGSPKRADWVKKRGCLRF